MGEGYVPVTFDGEHTPDEFFAELFVLAQQRENQLAVAVDEGSVVFLVVFEARPAVELS